MSGFAERLRAGRFQLAAVGQFKRGKSSLLNALLGQAVLPTGVVPLTAVPCFIAHAAGMTMAVEHAGGSDRRRFETAEGLAAALAGYVTETGNPHNGKRVTRVEIGLPAPILADGLVVIDTPGIGSAERHNSAAALAALPECDAALFVFSPDPPLSEAELGYLRAVQAHAALVIPVLSKADTVDRADREAVADYCRRVLSDAGVATDLSLVSSATGEGLEGLRLRLSALGAGERRRLLAAAIAEKAAGQIEELTFHNDAALAALVMPADALDAAAAEIDAAARRLLDHRRGEADLLAGERARLARVQEDEARALAADAGEALTAALDEALAGGADGAAAFAAVADRLHAFFEEALDRASAVQADRLRAITRATADRLSPELETLRRRAADALGIEARIAAPELDPGLSPRLAWNDRAAERMNPLPPGLLEAAMPARLRRRRVRRRLAGDVERLVTVNVERLRWALRQDGEEALRRLEARATETIDAAVAATIDIVHRLLARRGEATDAVASESSARRVWAGRLDEARARLAAR